MEKVYFIGAGPGDPELITIKGQRIVKEADVIIYAGSLVPKEVIDCHKKSAEIYNSASMSLEEVIDVIVSSVRLNKKVARVHTGDPSIYGAHREQMDILDKYEIELLFFIPIRKITFIDYEFQYLELNDIIKNLIKLNHHIEHICIK